LIDRDRYLLELTRAFDGALIGVAIGVIAIAVINNKLLNQRVTSLYKEGITNSNDIARLLCESVGQIEKNEQTS
jgi:hypothetical protein